MHDKARDKSDKMRISRTVAGSLGSGLFAVLVVGMVAFGASNIRPLTATRDADPTPIEKPAQEQPAARSADASAELGFAGGDEGVFRPEKDANDEPAEKAQPTEQPTVKEEPTEAPKPAAEPTEKPKQTEQPKPASDHLELDAWTKESYAKLAWSKYAGDAFEYYKVVRSRDATVTWPTGGDDELVAVVSDQWSPWAYDKPACGKEWHYRVFAVRHAEGGYQVLAASNVAGVAVDCAPTPPEPKAMGFEVRLTDAGAVKLAWEPCASDGFKYYKVVRSQTNELPTYPLQDGDELLAAIGDPGQTAFKDTDVQPGETWFYRVLSIGESGVLGATAAVAITVE